MAVFTAVSQPELEAWLTEHYTLGTVTDFRGISSGIENSNFFVTTERDGQTHQYVLTIFERLSSAQLPFYLYLMQHLAQHAVTVPAPIIGKDGEILRTLQGKPATLVTRLPGASNLAPQAEHCRQVGAMLARMHLAGQDYSRSQPNLRSLPWWQETVPQILPHVPADLQTLLQNELAFQTAFFASADYAALQGGPSHCDLFRDNVLFETLTVDGVPQDRLGGFFDFYFAGCDKWLFDLAVTVNDWCIDLATGEFDVPRAQAMLEAYHAVRPLTAVEARNWRAMLRAAAYRFWVSRLWDWYLPRAAEMLQPHDPRHFERVLQARLQATVLPWIHA